MVCVNTLFNKGIYKKKGSIANIFLFKGGNTLRLNLPFLLKCLAKDLVSRIFQVISTNLSTRWKLFFEPSLFLK